jgi:TP901 family phage tail tape measure protein
MDLNTTGFDSAASRVKSVWATMNSSSASTATKFQAAGSLMTSAGKTMTLAVTAPIVAGAYAASKAAITYESAFAGVRKTVDTTEENFKALYDGVLDMSKVMPESASAIAGVMEISGQLGVALGEGGKNLLDFTKIMVMMGATTNMSSEEAATSIAQFMTVMQSADGTAQNIGSTIVDLGNKFATTEKDIASMGQRLAAGAKLAGFTEAQTLALAAAMSSVGIEAEAGGTAMTQTFNEIEKAVAVGGEQLELFAQVSGMTAQEFADAWNNDPMTALQNFITGLGQLDENGGSAVLTLDALGLTGIRQSNMLKSLGLANDMLAKTVDVANTAWGENTALTEEAAKRNETFAAKLAMLRNNITSVGIAFGTIMMPFLEKIVAWLSKVVDWLGSLDEKTMKSILTIAGIVAAIGPVLLIVGQLVSVIGMMMNPIGAAIAGILAVAAAFTILYKKNDDFKASVDAAWIKMKESASAAFEKVKEPLTKLWESIKTIFSSIANLLGVDGLDIGAKLAKQIEFIGQMIEWAASVLSPFIDMVSALIDLFVEGFAALGALVKGDTEAAKEHGAKTLEALKDLGLGILKTLIEFFKGLGEMVISIINNIFEGLGIDVKLTLEGVLQSIGQFFVGVWTAASNWFKTAIKDVGTFFTTLFTSIGTFFSTAWQKVVDTISSGWESVVTFFTEGIPNAFNTVVEFFNNLPYLIGYAIGVVLQTFENWRQGILNWITTKVPEIIESIGTWFSELPAKIGEWFEVTWNNIVTWGENVKTKAAETGAAFIQSIVDWFTQLPVKIEEWFNTTLGKVEAWRLSTVEKGKKTASDFVNAIVDFIKTLPAKFQEWFDSVKSTLSRIDLRQIGKDILNSLWNGLKDIWGGIRDWFQGIADKVKEFVRGIKDGMSSAKSSGTGPSYATGLDYVPRTMNVTVHEGERILTKEQVERGGGGGTNIEISIQLINPDLSSTIGIERTGQLLGQALDNEIRARGADLA